MEHKEIKRWEKSVELDTPRNKHAAHKKTDCVLSLLSLTYSNHGFGHSEKTRAVTIKTIN